MSTHMIFSGHKLLYCCILCCQVFVPVLDLHLHTRETLVHGDCDIEPHLLSYPHISTAHPIRCPVGVFELAIHMHYVIL